MRAVSSPLVWAIGIACAIHACPGPSAALEVQPSIRPSERPFGLPSRWKDPALGEVVVEGAARGDRLWLLGSSGALVEFDLRRSRRRTMRTGVRDMLLDGPQLWIVSAGGGGSSWIVEDLIGRGAPESVRAFGEVAGLFKSGARLGLLAKESVTLKGPKWGDPKKIEVPLKGGRLAWKATPDGVLYVGRNRGEWGGELIAIDLVSGGVRELAKGNFTAVVGDPASPPCVLAATGLAHMVLRSGGLLRACGRDAPTEVFRAPLPESDPFGGSWPLEDLAPLRRGWAAASSKRLFISRGPGAAETPMPPLRRENGIWINDDDPEMLVILRSCCWGRADNPTSYGVILVPRLPR